MIWFRSMWAGEPGIGVSTIFRSFHHGAFHAAVLMRATWKNLSDRTDISGSDWPKLGATGRYGGGGAIVCRMKTARAFDGVDACLGNPLHHLR